MSEYTWEITYKNDKGKTKKVKIDIDVCIHPDEVEMIQLYNKRQPDIEYNPISYKEFK